VFERDQTLGLLRQIYCTFSTVFTKCIVWVKANIRFSWKKWEEFAMCWEPCWELVNEVWKEERSVSIYRGATTSDLNLWKLRYTLRDTYWKRGNKASKHVIQPQSFELVRIWQQVWMHPLFSRPRGHKLTTRVRRCQKKSKKRAYIITWMGDECISVRFVRAFVSRSRVQVSVNGTRKKSTHDIWHPSFPCFVPYRGVLAKRCAF